MDTKFEWRDEFNIGVDIIDKEHQRLFKIINKLFMFKDEGKDDQWTCQEGIKFFKGHTMKHFAEEEAYMQSIGYAGLEQHRLIHNGFKQNTLPALEQELERTNYAPDSVDHFLGVCAGWLIGHTMTEDQAIAGKHIRKWENLLPGEELMAMRKVIIQLVFDMFHLESQLISDVYNGEKFGRGVYYRLVYGTKNDKKRKEVLLVFEEKLLINTVGKIMGIKTNKLDNMLIHAVRYTARRFVESVMEAFPSMDGYVLKEENLLSYEQFHRVLEHEKLQVSLLFNTGGAGYFAYCMIAPHLLEEGVGDSVEDDYEMDEVDRYLMQHRKARKTRAAKVAAHEEPEELDDEEYALDELDKYLSQRTKTKPEVVKVSRPETLVKESSAMDEVSRYLTQREVQEEKRQKPKVLVVDDSMTMRYGMKKLLDEDYDVSMVDSGVAAIRAITLNQPDLVLLDYEMPVCDGRQTLEMLRSLPEFSGVPVVFLTGRSDPASVRNVMSLKPAGYLLKNLKPADIKKKIDAFFVK